LRFQNAAGQFARHGRETFEKFVKRVIVFQILEQRLYRHARAFEHRRAAENVRINSDEVVRLHAGDLPHFAAGRKSSNGGNGFEPQALVIAETRVRAKHNRPFYALKALWKLAQGWLVAPKPGEGGSERLPWVTVPDSPKSATRCRTSHPAFDRSLTNNQQFSGFRIVKPLLFFRQKGHFGFFALFSLSKTPFTRRDTDEK